MALLSLASLWHNMEFTDDYFPERERRYRISEEIDEDEAVK